MKTLKTFTISVLMLGITISTKAQEKQNDATWEETSSFLQKYANFFNCISLISHENYGCKNIKSIDFSHKWIEVEIDENEGYEQYDFDYNKYGETVYRGLSKYHQNILIPMEYFKYISGTKITLVKPIDYKVYLKHIDGFKGNKGTRQETKQIQVKNFYLHLNDDDELEPRIKKALEHLVYLATEQRKKEREESGEKF